MGLDEDKTFSDYSMSMRPDHISVPDWQFMLMEEIDSNMEQADKYRVMYVFDKICFFHTDFIETIALTWDTPDVWDVYIYSLDNMTPTKNEKYNSVLYKISRAILYSHQARCDIIIEDDHFFGVLESIRTLFAFYAADENDQLPSEEELTKMGRQRKGWFPLQAAYWNYCQYEEHMESLDKPS